MAKDRHVDDDQGDNTDPDDRPTAFLTYDPNEYRDLAVPLRRPQIAPPENKRGDKVPPAKK